MGTRPKRCFMLARTGWKTGINCKSSQGSSRRVAPPYVSAQRARAQLMVDVELADDQQVLFEFNGLPYNW